MDDDGRGQILFDVVFFVSGGVVGRADPTCSQTKRVRKNHDGHSPGISRYLRCYTYDTIDIHAVKTRPKHIDRRCVYCPTMASTVFPFVIQRPTNSHIFLRRMRGGGGGESPHKPKASRRVDR